MLLKGLKLRHVWFFLSSFSVTGAQSLMKTSRITMETRIHGASVGWLLFDRWRINNVQLIIKCHDYSRAVFRAYFSFLLLTHGFAVSFLFPQLQRWWVFAVSVSCTNSSPCIYIWQDTLELPFLTSTQPVNFLKNKESHLWRSLTTVREWCTLPVSLLPHSLFRTVFVSTGKMKGLAFIQDPDGYWIEILSPNTMLSITS